MTDKIEEELEDIVFDVIGRINALQFKGTNKDSSACLSCIVVDLVAILLAGFIPDEKRAQTMGLLAAKASERADLFEKSGFVSLRKAQ